MQMKSFGQLKTKKFLPTPKNKDSNRNKSSVFDGPIVQTARDRPLTRIMDERSK